MVYHMKNIDFLKDLQIITPRKIRNIVKESLENTTTEGGRVRFDGRRIGEDYIKDTISKILNECTATKTDEGFEACLNLNKMKLSEEFIGPNFEASPKYEDFLEAIDVDVFELKQLWCDWHKV